MNLLHLLKTSWGRLTAGITLMLTVAWLNDGKITGDIDWRATTAFAAALLAWSYGCLPDRKGPSAHDKDLFRRFRELIDDNALRFLRDQDFGSAFHLDQLEGLREVAATWTGPDYEFDDKAIQKEFGPMLVKLRALSTALAVKTQMISAHAARIHWDYANEEASRATAKKLNDHATALAEAIDKLIPTARRRLE